MAGHSSILVFARPAPLESGSANHAREGCVRGHILRHRRWASRGDGTSIPSCTVIPGSRLPGRQAIGPWPAPYPGLAYPSVSPRSGSRSPMVCLSYCLPIGPPISPPRPNRPSDARPARNRMSRNEATSQIVALAGRLFQPCRRGGCFKALARAWSHTGANGIRIPDSIGPIEGTCR